MLFTYYGIPFDNIFMCLHIILNVIFVMLLFVDFGILEYNDFPGFFKAYNGIEEVDTFLIMPISNFCFMFTVYCPKHVLQLYSSVKKKKLKLFSIDEFKLDVDKIVGRLYDTLF